MPTTEITRSANGIVGAEQVDDLRRQLPELAAAGDVDGLLSIARDAEPAALLVRKRGFDVEANRLIRLKIEAEAALGALERGGMCEAPTVRDEHRWHLFEIAKDRGRLGEMMDKAEAGGGELTAGVFVKELSRAGIAGVSSSVVKGALEKWRRDQGLVWMKHGENKKSAPGKLSMEEIAAMSGVTLVSIHRALGRGTRPRSRMEWWVAAAIGRFCGVDPKAWPLAPDMRRGGRRRAARWLTREVKPTGGRWDECYSRFRKCLDEFQRLAPNADTRWDEAYAHFYALNAAIEKAVRKS